MAEADAREALERLIEERGEDYSALSRLIGGNAAYVQQFIERGTITSRDWISAMFTGVRHEIRYRCILGLMRRGS